MSGELVVTLCASVLTLAGVCITAWASVKKASIESQSKVDNLGAGMQKKLDGLEAKVDKNTEHNLEQHLGILRLTVMSPEMPISERLIAGQKYIDQGGNGDVKKYYEQMIADHTH